MRAILLHVCTKWPPVLASTFINSYGYNFSGYENFVTHFVSIHTKPQWYEVLSLIKLALMWTWLNASMMWKIRFIRVHSKQLIHFVRWFFFSFIHIKSVELCAASQFSWTYFLLYLSVAEHRPHCNHAMKYVLFLYESSQRHSSSPKECEKWLSTLNRFIWWRFMSKYADWKLRELKLFFRHCKITDKWCNECKISPWQSA